MQEKTNRSEEILMEEYLLKSELQYNNINDEISLLLWVANYWKGKANSYLNEINNNDDCFEFNKDEKEFILYETLVKYSLLDKRNGIINNNKFKYNRDIINFICNTKNTYVADMPVFNFKGRSISVEEQKITFEDFKKIVLNTPEKDFIVYTWTTYGEFLLIKYARILRDITKEMEDFFKPLLTDLLIVTKPEYPNSVFYKKDGEVIFELYQNSENKEKRYFWVDYYKIWLVFEIEFRLECDEIQYFIKSQVENILKIGSIIPFWKRETSFRWWKELYLDQSK